MKMSHYSGKQTDPKRNISYGSTDQELFIPFTYDPMRKYPVRVEMIGITYPDKNYFIERKHGDYFVLEYVVSGKGYVETEEGRFDVEEDGVYLLQPGKPHCYGADKHEPYEKIWINFFSDVFTDVLAAYGISGTVVFPNAGCRKLFEQLLAIAERSDRNDDIYLDVSGVLFEIMLCLARNTATKRTASTVANLVRETLDACIYRKVSIDKISEQLNISKSQITREFHRAYGVAPYQYILDKKIQVAKRLLVSSGMRITQISALLSFSDTYYFSNLFKQKTGMSPLKYRTLHRKNDEASSPPQAERLSQGEEKE